jgi:hypothetical protein
MVIILYFVCVLRYDLEFGEINGVGAQLCHRKS